MENKEFMYTSSDGSQIPVSKMQNSHLVNALLKVTDGIALKKYADPADSFSINVMKEAQSAMKAEVLRRMPIQ